LVWFAQLGSISLACLTWLAQILTARAQIVGIRFGLLDFALGHQAHLVLKSEIFVDANPHMTTQMDPITSHTFIPNIFAHARADNAQASLGPPQLQVTGP